MFSYHCDKCGKKLEIEFSNKIDHYNSVTGKPVYIVNIKCPDFRRFLTFNNGHYLYWGFTELRSVKSLYEYYEVTYGTS